MKCVSLSVPRARDEMKNGEKVVNEKWSALLVARFECCSAISVAAQPAAGHGLLHDLRGLHHAPWMLGDCHLGRPQQTHLHHQARGKNKQRRPFFIRGEFFSVSSSKMYFPRVPDRENSDVEIAAHRLTSKDKFILNKMKVFLVVFK
jgi:hypothetical protein